MSEEGGVVSRAVLFLVMFALFGALLSGCGSEDPEFSTPKSSPGVTEGEILLGSSLALTGHASYLGVQTYRGAMCYIKQVNEAGGVHGRKIRVIAYDDSYDPPKCMANTQRLVVEDQVFALFCYVGTPTTVKIVSALSEAEIPLVGMFTGANALRHPFNPWIINVRASYYQETEAAVRHLVQDLGVKKIAVFYQYDAYGFDGLTGTELALQMFGLEPVARGSYVRGSLNVEEAFERIEASGAQAVVMIGTYDPCARFIQLAAAADYHPVFYTVSFVGADELARRLGSVDKEVVIMTQVAPPPEGDAQTQELLGSATEYVDLLAKYYPEDKPNFVGLEGYINARVLVEGLRRAGPDLTRRGFVRAIESLENYRIGPGVSVSFSETDHQGMDRVYFTWLQNGRFRLLEDWGQVKRAWMAGQSGGAEPAGAAPGPAPGEASP
ncbi:MAG: ABC transporter substrate-binding protein [Desulfovibrionaceae bacterium]